MTPPADSLSEVLCPCSGTTRQQILRVLERGETTLKEVSHATGACSGCGGCEFDVVTCLAEFLETPQPQLPQSG